MRGQLRIDLAREIGLTLTASAKVKVDDLFERGELTRVAVGSAEGDVSKRRRSKGSGHRAEVRAGVRWRAIEEGPRGGKGCLLDRDLPSSQIGALAIGRGHSQIVRFQVGQLRAAVTIDASGA